MKRVVLAAIILAGAAHAAPPTSQPTGDAAALDTLHSDLQAILKQLQANATTAAPAAPAAPASTEYEVASNLPTVAGATVKAPAGTEIVPVHIAVPLTIQGAGMRLSLADGRGGVDAGHRLAYGKGFFHLGAGPVLIQDFGFLDSARNGNGTSDGETSAYAEGWTGMLTFNRVAFDGQEDGVFVPNGPAGAGIDVTIRSSVFGRVSANGLNDGRSHDIYVNGRSLVVDHSVFMGNSRGNQVKSRSADVAVTGSYVGASNGRWIDLPARTRFASSGNTYTVAADAGSNNRIGIFDEQDTSQGAPAGSYTSTDDLYCIGPRDAVVWNNDPAMTMAFVRPVLHWQGAAGANPPSFIVQGPGAVTGLRPMTQADRVDACPAPPADPKP